MHDGNNMLVENELKNVFMISGQNLQESAKIGDCYSTYQQEKSCVAKSNL